MSSAMLNIDIPGVICEVFMGIWRFAQEWWDSLEGFGGVMLHIILVLFFIYLFLDVIYGIFRVCRDFIHLFLGDDNNSERN